MKTVKSLFAALLFVLCSNISQAQFRPLSPPQKRTTEVKTQTSPGLESQPTRTQPVQPATVSYFLSLAKVDIRTGNDNKEALSNVSVELAVRNTANSIFAQNNLTNEMKANSTTSIGLEKANAYTSGYSSNPLPGKYHTTATGTQAIMLSDVEKHGLALRIIYKPNFFADAWKIESVSVTLEFRDVNGNAHPSSGQKTITFPSAATFLDNFDKRVLVCIADSYFNPLSSFVTKDLATRW